MRRPVTLMVTFIERATLLVLGVCVLVGLFHILFGWGRL